MHVKTADFLIHSFLWILWLAESPEAVSQHLWVGEDWDQKQKRLPVLELCINASLIQIPADLCHTSAALDRWQYWK